MDYNITQSLNTLNKPLIRILCNRWTFAKQEMQIENVTYL